MNTREAIRFYEDLYLRWLKAKRDYPWANDPEPKPPPEITGWLATQIREKLIKDFERKS